MSGPGVSFWDPPYKREKNIQHPTAVYNSANAESDIEQIRMANDYRKTMTPMTIKDIAKNYFHK